MEPTRADFKQNRPVQVFFKAETTILTPLNLLQLRKIEIYHVCMKLASASAYPSSKRLLHPETANIERRRRCSEPRTTQNGFDTRVHQNWSEKVFCK